MRAERIKALLPLIRSKRTGERGQWVEAPCPLAPWRHGGTDHHPSFGIKAETSKKSICKCLSCGWGGDLTDLIYELHRLMKKSPADGYNLAKAGEVIAQEFAEIEITLSDIPDYEEAVASHIDQPFPEDFLKSFLPVWKSKEAMTYLQNRRIPLLLCKELELVYDPHQRRVGFPFRNMAGKLMGVQGRAIYPEATLRYFQYGYLDRRNAQCWMGEDKLDLDKPLVLCEGPIDKARIMQYYPNVAASFTSGLSVEKIKRLQDCTEIITFYDYGKGGDAAREKLREVLTKASFIDIIPSPEEGDAGAMTNAELKHYLFPYVPLFPEDHWDKLQSY